MYIIILEEGSPFILRDEPSEDDFVAASDGYIDIIKIEGNKAKRFDGINQRWEDLHFYEDLKC